MSGSPDYKLDIAGVKGGSDSSESEQAKSERPYLSVLFACCSVYQRIYRNPEATAYLGRCPRCGKPVKIGISPDGTDAREFVVH
jgi:hypothetical protein